MKKTNDYPQKHQVFKCSCYFRQDGIREFKLGHIANNHFFKIQYFILNLIIPKELNVISHV
jgi:hypothetical protein